MPYYYRLASGGHSDKNAKLLDRKTGKHVDLPKSGANPGDVLIYEEQPDFVKTDKRFQQLDGDVLKAMAALPNAPAPGAVDPVVFNADPGTATLPPQVLDPDQKANTNKPSTKKAASTADDDDDGDLESMTVEQLKDYAEENEIDLGGARLKDEIVKAIKSAEA